MKTILLSIILFAMFSAAKGQSQVPNGDFEQYTNCPTDISQLDTATYWITPSEGTSDYFNECTTEPNIDVPQNLIGFQHAHSGVGYAGIYFYDIFYGGIELHYREYAEVQLTSPMIADSCYRFEMYMSLANTSMYAVSNVEVYFSDVLISNVPSDSQLLVIPQITNSAGFITDTLNWVLFSGEYTASGGENYLIIGNFQSDSQTDTLRVNQNIAIENYAYYYIDDVTLSACTGVGNSIPEPGENTGINIYTDPSSTQLFISSLSQNISSIIIYDLVGKEVFNEEFNSANCLLNIANWNSGVYLVKIKTEEGEVVRKVVKN